MLHETRSIPAIQLAAANLICRSPPANSHFPSLVMKRRRIMKHGLLAAPIIIPTEILKESLRDIQTEEVVSLFDSIEKVLNSLHLKRRVSDWETVKSAAAIFFQGQVSLADINMIMEIYPEAYIIKWQPNSNDEKKTELCIKLPIQFFGKFETRSTKFRCKFQ